MSEVGECETSEFDLNKKMSENFMWKYVNKVSAYAKAKVDQVSECDHRIWADCVCGM
jgi:hypothetical protein